MHSVDLGVRRATVEMCFFWGYVMAWKWPGSSSENNNEEWTGFIDQGVTMEGTLQVSGTFRIDGNVKGNIISEQTVILGENAKVEGQIEGNRVVIAGRYDGVIFAKGRVEIQAKGVVTGEVHAPCMVIDPGGIFDGRCHMLASSDATASMAIPIRAISQG
jgi:cytoskeletal protein CcmA (bactofilin family)